MSVNVRHSANAPDTEKLIKNAVTPEDWKNHLVEDLMKF